jgi:capsid protein
MRSRYTGGLTLPDKLPDAWFNNKVEATLDLTRTTRENQRHWKDADPLSARAAYPQSQRKIARERSRLEASNNSWYAGVLRTAANHIVGTGPRLQVMTSDKDVNARIERHWRKWAMKIRLAEKLRIAVETYWRDGEVYGMRASSAATSLGLDIRLYEGDQITQPYYHLIDNSIDDGKRVDNLGNAIEYWILKHHPGDIGVGFANPLDGEWYPASEVWHLYRADRPGQLHGIPRCAPAIDWLAHMRRFSKATLSAAELFALMPYFMKTTGSSTVAARMPEDMMTVAYERGVMNFLPDGWEGWSPDPKYPNATEEMVMRIGLMYFGRCANMPFSLVCGTSKDANFSAAKMDIKNLWQPEVTTEQDTITNIVLVPTFRWFLEDAVLTPGVLDGAPPIDEIDFCFQWPPLPQSDEIEVANAVEKRVSTGQSTLREEYARMGKDFDSSAEIAARDYGVSIDEYKRALFTKLLGSPPISSIPQASSPQETVQNDQLHDAFSKAEEVPA